MLDQEDLKWIAATSTELNSMLQQISRYADLARQHKGEYNYIEMLGERVELASKSTQALFDRVTSSILTAKVARPNEREHQHPHAPFSVVPPPGTPPTKTQLPAVKNVPPTSAKPLLTSLPKEAVVPAEFKVVNPTGARELILLV